MARIHARKRGKSGSKRPVERKVQPWVRYKAVEVELLIGKLSKEGKSSSEIGLILRDTYGVPDVKALTGKSITKIMEEKGSVFEVPEDLLNLIKKLVRIKSHLEENNHDLVSKRALQLTDSKIRRLIKYYKNSGKLSKDWKYDLDKIKLLIH